jgi:hypothetical protein
MAALFVSPSMLSQYCFCIFHYPACLHYSINGLGIVGVRGRGMVVYILVVARVEVYVSTSVFA